MLRLYSVSTPRLRFAPIVLSGLLLTIHSVAGAQLSRECELIQERIAGTGNVNSTCSGLYRECVSKATKSSDAKELQNQCLKHLGDCQMAGRLSGADLQRVIDQYESVCRVKQPAP
jgi:hypothetical protein